jgi:hypothetical protein
MSGLKTITGHRLSDGTGRDSYSVGKRKAPHVDDCFGPCCSRASQMCAIILSRAQFLLPFCHCFELQSNWHESIHADSTVPHVRLQKILFLTLLAHAVTLRPDGAQPRPLVPVFPIKMPGW